ncbi:probable chitinase 2 [Amyelois transitella]|uniref:probable chitinase 2 n=1 Tax=Amyelois transitella TaxID=680683 RepID=UPI00067A82D9|nr:probable chitinase 2 [Amyelois transitella]
MLRSVCLFVALFYGFSVTAQSSGGPRHGKAVVCYVATWAAYRKGAGQFEVDNLNPSLCTHLVYTFAGLDDKLNTIKSLDEWMDFQRNSGAVNKILALKERYPHLKVTIAIGGWNEGSARYSNMTATREGRKKFIDSVLSFLNKYKFDGLDLDWEYPAKRGGVEQDKNNYVSLVKELKEAFRDHGYILTAAFGAGKSTMDVAYDLPRLSQHLDLIHMMCYDYHGTWDGTVGANAPLRGISDDDVLSVEYTIKYMLDHGVKPHKMVLGLPMYGRTFVLKNPNITHVEFGVTKVEASGFKGPYTGENGFMGYNEICMEIENNGSSWQKLWHEQTSTPYLRNGEKVLSYDNRRSIAAKVKMAIDYNLGGVMVWSIDTDDFNGNCKQGEPDAFKDFYDRYKTLKNDPVLKEALKTLHLRDNNLSSHTAYTVSDGNLHLRIPNPMSPNYPLMQSIDQAMTLALEEKRINDEMENVARGNEIAHKDEPDSANMVNAASVLCFAALVLVKLL